MSGLGDSPAYPAAYFDEDGEDTRHPGMTYRQWVAGLCAAGQLSHPSYDSKPEDVARHAVACADALIAALEGTPASSGEPPRPARVLDVPCGACAAVPGAPCREDGQDCPPHRIHSARALAFAAAYEPEGA